MSYIINKTDGSVLTEIVDGTIDQVSTDLTLIGKNSSAYGELFNENFVHILENFANTSSPSKPVQGQLWYDTSEGRLKVYDGSSWKVSSGTVVSNAIPTLTQGDLWIDSLRQQLYFNDGNANLLAGPIYTAQQGLSGFQVTDLVDINGLSHTIVSMYVAQTLLGIYSKDKFTPVAPIVGWSGSLWNSNIRYNLGDRVIFVVNSKPLAFEAIAVASAGDDIGFVPLNTAPTDGTYWKEIFINPGFNAGSLANIKFNVPATQADSLIASDGTAKTPDSFLSSIDDTTTAIGTLIIQNSVPLKLGAQSNTEIHVDSSLFEIYSNTVNQNFAINTLTIDGTNVALRINASASQMGIFTDTPTATLDVNGDARIRGDLVVEGFTTTINSSNLSVEDKLIELGSVTGILSRSGVISSSATTSTITGLDSVTGIIPGMAVTKVSGAGAFGSNAVVFSVDSETQITVIADTSNTQGAITFSLGGATNTSANGGGILLKGDTDKTLSWSSTTSSWTSSENFDLVSGKSFSINGFEVLSQTDLGVTVTSALGLNTIGTLNSLQVSYLGFNNNTISYVNSSVSNGNIVLEPKNGGTVDVSSKKITNVANPTDAADAVNFSTMDYAVRTYAQSFSINQGALTNSQIANTIVTKMCPIGEHLNDAKVRVWCIDTSTAKEFTLVGYSWQFTTDL